MNENAGGAGIAFNFSLSSLSLSLSGGVGSVRSIDSKGVILGGFDESDYFLLYVVGLWTGVRDTSDGLIRDERDTAR